MGVGILGALGSLGKVGEFSGDEISRFSLLALDGSVYYYEKPRGMEVRIRSMGHGEENATRKRSAKF